ncbi:MAG: elongation factor G [Desulforhopalus sp.]|nr:elongation factor G [Desulforhopalus sp.]
MTETADIRNVVIAGHGSSGKTSLAEAMLFTAGKVDRLGKVDEGTSAMDYEPEEIERKISINASFHNFPWADKHIFLTDTPGDDNFLNETRFAVYVSDAAIYTIGAVVGVKGQTKKFAKILAERALPTAIVITKMDRERANFTHTFLEIKDTLPQTPVAVQLPVGEADKFRGYVDLITGRAFLYGPDGTLEKTEIPPEMDDEVTLHREVLMENIAETDDELIEKFLEEGELSVDEMVKGLKGAMKIAAFSPVLVSSGTDNKGAGPILDFIAAYMPSPLERPAIMATKADELVEVVPRDNGPFAALVFKTMADPYAGRLTLFRVFSGHLSGDTFYNATKKTSERFGQLFLMEGREQKPVDEVVPGMIVAVAKLKETATCDTLCSESDQLQIEPPEPRKPVISFAVSAAKGEEEKVFGSLTRMLGEDLTLKLERQEQTREVLLSGVGRVHLDVVGSRIKRKFGVEMELSIPKIPYMETIKKSVKVQGKHKKQSGGRGQYGDCWVEISPFPGGGYEFVDQIVGGVIPQTYRPAVDKGIQEAMERGVLAGYPVIDVKIVLVDGTFHNVDSSEMAFKIAGSLAFKAGALDAQPVLLEPCMNMTVYVDKDNVGDVMGDISSRRGKVMGMDSANGFEIINAQVPQAEILMYASDLTSMTGGIGSFEVSFSHYEEVPAQIAEKIIAASKAVA